jgi:hypothetical protein
MLDDLLIHLFGEAVFGKLGRSRRAQLLFRVFFGLIGAGLGVAGAVHFALKTDLTRNTAMHLSIVGLFVFLTSFSLFNVALGRKWRWPGVFFAISFVSLFATRIVFGP